MGRFLSPDPKIMTARHLANPQKWNKYAYVINNPLMRFDPDGMDDYVVFRTVTSGTNGAAWAAAGASITSQRDSKGRLNTFHMMEGDAATVSAYRKALGTADTHVIFVGHSAEDDPHSPHPNALGVQLNNGDSEGKNGSNEMRMTTSPSANPGEPDNVNLSIASTLSDPIAASSVALFSCNSVQLGSQYDGTDFTGVQSGPFSPGTELETLDQMAADWVSAGGGQAGTNAANWDLANSSYLVDFGGSVQNTPPPQPH
jgi:hypothetical protein